MVSRVCLQIEGISFAGIFQIIYSDEVGFLLDKSTPKADRNICDYF